MHKIGVFDSGVGGLSVAQAIQAALPDDEVFFTNDPEHFPYANRKPEELLGFVLPILEGLVDAGCEVIVIACNTVSTTLIGDLRDKISVPLIAMEPMVKPAAEKTTSKVIAICATPTTLASKRYHELKEQFAQGITVIEPDCSDWSAMIESNTIDRANIEQITDDACSAGADIIVLACTHYHWIENIIADHAAGRAAVLQPEQPVIEQLKRILVTAKS
jgi:glutamate racemase